MKLLILGNSGSGKSTYARRVAAASAVQCLALDSFVWEPHEIAVARPLERARADLSAFIARNEAWVIEGCDGDLVEEALPACSELLFLNNEPP